MAYERSVLAPHSQKLEAYALAKVFDCTTEDFIKTAVRHRSGITRSRKAAKRDKNFSEAKNREFIEFCKATGLRKKEYDEERVVGVYIRKGYKVVEYVKHDISAGYRTIPLSKKAKKILE